MGLTWSATPALASENEISVWAGPTVANATALGTGSHWGVGGQVGVNWGFLDFWSLAADAQTSYQFADSQNHIPGVVVGQLAVGIRYDLDVFSYVPYAALDATFYPQGPVLNASGSQEVAAGVKLVLGVDWRPARAWSLGLRLEIHEVFNNPGSFPGYSTLCIDGGYHFRVF